VYIVGKIGLHSSSLAHLRLTEQHIYHVIHINLNTDVLMFVAECWERCGCLWRNTSLSVAASSNKVCVSVVNARLLQVTLIFPTISEMLSSWMLCSCWHFLFVPYVANDAVVLSDGFGCLQYI